MKQDMQFIKEILEAMTEYPKYEINGKELIEKLDPSLCKENNEETESFIEKFYGHLKLLGDSNCIEIDRENYGVRTGFSADGMPQNVNLRLTSQGHEFLDGLRNDTVFNTIKGYSLSTALATIPVLLPELIKKGLGL